MSWMNSDGLFVKFGAEEADVAKGGAWSVDGRYNVLKASISDMSLIGATSEIIGAEDGVSAPRGLVIPSGAFIEKVVVTVLTACAGATATLNVGLVQSSDRSTAIDADGLVAALAVTSIDAAGDIVELIQGGTSHGALIGTTTAAEGILVADYDTAAFTAGAIDIEVYWT